MWVTFLCLWQRCFDYCPPQLADAETPALGANVSTRLSAVQVQVRCAVPKTNMTGITSEQYYSLVGTLPNNCTANSLIPYPRNNTWYGWSNAAEPECVKGINPNETIGDPDLGLFLTPAIITFLKNATAYSMVLCYSTLTEHDVQARLGFGAHSHGITELIGKRFVGSLGYGPNG